MSSPVTAREAVYNIVEMLPRLQPKRIRQVRLSPALLRGTHADGVTAAALRASRAAP